MKASDEQVGGKYYKDFVIQPGEFSTKNKLRYFPGQIVARICRYDKPGGDGLEDLEKIKHEVDLIIEWDGWKEEEETTKPVFTFTPGLPKLRICKCGCTPYMNYGNGQYWIECPFCHTVGCKSDMQYGAQTYWNDDEDSGRGK